jgi:hypothetical protein
MAGASGFWARVGNEVRTVSDRTRRGAKRAVQIGVIRVDLISLRRDRSQALADLGGRALALWNDGAPASIEFDEEALRLRSRVVGVEGAIEAKEAELAQLRRGASTEPPTPGQPTPASMESQAP